MKLSNEEIRANATNKQYNC
uniref:Uncharacterized protein n=1 Tax=Arundo donax TaxID=35708 RepID=A0A0A9BEV8_ARUDO